MVIDELRSFEGFREVILKNRSADDGTWKAETNPKRKFGIVILNLIFIYLIS
jgi:hypothetical protein